MAATESVATRVVATAGLASLLPAPGSWPLPTGLGGVVGDAVLALPRRLLPASPWATIAVGAGLAAIAILGLAAASGVGGSANSPEDALDHTAGKARARALARFDDEDDQDEPSFGMVSIGAVIHALLTAKATLRRMASRGSRKASAPSPLVHTGPAPASPAPWSAARDADDISTIAAALAPRAQTLTASPSVGAPPVVSSPAGRPTAARAASDMSGRPRGECGHKPAGGLYASEALRQLPMMILASSRSE